MDDFLETYIRRVFQIVLAFAAVALAATVIALIALAYFAATTSVADVGASVGEAVKAFKDAAQ